MNNLDNAKFEAIRDLTETDVVIRVWCDVCGEERNCFIDTGCFPLLNAFDADKRAEKLSNSQALTSRCPNCLFQFGNDPEFSVKLRPAMEVGR